MAMGFDLAQGWAAYLKREVEGWGGVFETRDPNWSAEAGGPGDHRPRSTSEPKPDVLVVHSPDLNSYAKLLKKAQSEGIYVVLIDNPDELPGRRLHRQRLGPARPARGRSGGQGLRRGVIQEDRPGAGRPGQRLQPLPVCRHHEGAGEASRLQGRRQARSRTGIATTSRNVTATMLQQNPDICAIIDFWDGDATGTAAAIRDAGKRRQDRSWSPPAAARRSIATSWRTATSPPS